MARPKNNEPRILGPYLEPRGYRVVHVTRSGARTSYYAETEKAALRIVAALELELAQPDKTIKQALAAYETFMKDVKGNKPNSIDQTQRKLRRFFGDLSITVADLNERRCRALYETLRTSTRQRKLPPAAEGLTVANAKTAGKPVSVDYHRNALAEAKTFLRWCVKEGMIDENPLEAVEGVGRRRHGKAQLRIDEARKWLRTAVDLASDGEAGAVAAMATLLMGLRASETIQRVVRDLDDEGRLLWIPDSKTEAGKRAVLVPEPLRPFLRALAEGKRSEQLLFGKHWRDWPREWVQRICRRAGVVQVTAHGMRGLHATLAVEAGSTGPVVAAAMGHESFAQTTARSYARREAIGKARQDRVLTVMVGGAG
jgi:integrase